MHSIYTRALIFDLVKLAHSVSLSLPRGDHTEPEYRPRYFLRNSFTDPVIARD